MSIYSQLFLRETGSPYGDITRNSTLSFKDLDQNFIFLKERDINQLRVDGSNLIYETLGGTEYSVNIGGASTGATDTYVTGFTFNTGTNILTIKQNESQSDLTTNLSSLSSDVYVLSGNYNPTTGNVTYTNSTGGTFVVSGFTTGMTDTFVTGGTLTGTNLVLEKSNGVDTSTIDLSPLGDTYAIVGSYLDERVARWNSTTNTLQNGLIRDDGTTTSIGNGPSASNLFFVDTTTLTSSILGQVQNGNAQQSHAVRALNKNGSASNNVYATAFLGQSEPTGTPTGGLYIAGRFIQGNFSEFAISGNIELTGLQIEVDTTTSSDEIYGIKIDKIDINDAVSGDVYGIKLNPYTGAGVVSGTKYGIYQEGTDKNYFGGQLQLNTVGGTPPVTNLGVDASGNVVSGTTGGSSLWSENSGDGIYFNTAGDVVAIGDTATNGIAEEGKLYVKGDALITYALKVDSSNDGLALTVDNSQHTFINDLHVGGTDGSPTFDFQNTNARFFLDGSSPQVKGTVSGSNRFRLLVEGGHGELELYNNLGTQVYELSSATSANYDNTGQDFTFGTTTSLGARVGIRGTGIGSGTSSLVTEDSGGNTTFEVKDDGTIVIPNVGGTTPVTNLGVDASGNIVSGTTGGGGSSPWVDNGSSIVYSGHGDYVEFKDEYFQIAPDSTSNTIGANSNQSTYIGTGITAAANSTTRTLVLGIGHTVAGTSFVSDSIIAGNTNTIGGGSNNLIVGKSLTVDAATNAWIGGNVGNNITSISDSLIFSTGVIQLTDTMVDCVILGNSSFGVKGDTVFGFGDDLYGNSTSNSEVMMLGFNVQLNNPTSKSILIGSGQNDGQYLQINSTYEKGIYYGVGSSKPWFALTEAQSGVGTGTSGKVGNIFFGVDIADEGGTANVGEGIMWLQESTVNPSANITDAGALYNSGGTITWWDGTTNYNLTSSGGGGSSLWTDKGDSGNGINYTSGDADQSYVEINSGTGGNLNTFNADQYKFGGLFIGYNNDFGTASNYIDSSVGMGTQNTWGALGDVSYTLGIGSSNEIKSGIAGFAVGTNIEISGNYNVALGQSHEVYGADNKAIGQSIFIGKAANLRNNCVGIGDSMQIGKSGGADHHVSIGFGINTQYYTNERAIFFGTQTGNNSRPSAGFFQDPGGTSTHPSNFVMGSMNAMRTGSPYPAQSGAGNGIFYLHDADSLGVVAPSVNVAQAVALFASDRDSPAGNPDVTGLLVKSENGGKSWIGDRIGINVSYTGTDPDLTKSIDASLHIRGEGATNATSSLIINDSGTNVNFKVTDDGVTIFRTFTVATLPTVVAGGFIYVSDETGGATMAFSDGTNWRRVQDRAIVS